MRLPATFSDRVAELCRVVAPHDLAARAIYVIPYSSLADEHPRLAGGCCCGWTLPYLDVLLRPVLADRGLWRGRGFACIIRDDRLINESAALATALHELSHGVGWQAPAATAPADEVDRLLCVPLNEFTDDWLPSTKRKDKPAPWHAHADRFIRAAIHVAYRASQLGHHTLPADLQVAGRFYGLSHARRYALALGDEPRELAELPIRSILDSPAPAAFDRLWADDTAPALAAA